MEKYQKEIEYVLEMTRKNRDVFINQYPHVSTNYFYKPEKNELWTSSFFPGMCYLAYEFSQDKAFLKYEEEYLKSFGERVKKNQGMDHDAGFLYTLSCVADYKLTNNQEAKEYAEMAADLLASRFHEKGNYIQAWGNMNSKYPDVKIIVDTMLNLPLLYWTGDKNKIAIAKAHAHTAADYLIRSDFSSFHTYLMNPETGKAVCGKTHQGYRDDSTWARGQAWAVYGFALSYFYTREKRFLDVSKKTAEVFIKNLPSDYVCYWDFTFTDEHPDIRDTSAAAIFVCGLLELCNYVTEEESAGYREIVDKIMGSLIEHYSTREMKHTNGLLKEGMYHRTNGAQECVIWGDYFYMEALMRLTRKWNPYW